MLRAASRRGACSWAVGVSWISAPSSPQRGSFPDSVPSPHPQDMARDEKNYYQDTPKQIKRKIGVYKRFYPEEFQAFTASLQQVKMDQQ